MRMWMMRVGHLLGKRRQMSGGRCKQRVLIARMADAFWGQRTERAEMRGGGSDGGRHGHQIWRQVRDMRWPRSTKAPLKISMIKWRLVWLLLVFWLLLLLLLLRWQRLR